MKIADWTTDRKVLESLKDGSSQLCEEELEKAFTTINKRH